jgi:Domain of unknown function (DUF5668)
MSTAAQPGARNGRLPHPASFGAGAFFTLAGIVSLLEQFDVLRIDAGVLWPLLLIGLGLAVVAEEAVARLARS